MRLMIRERNYIRANSLLKFQDEATWYKLYRERDPPSFVAMVLLTPEAFDFVLAVFIRFYDIKPGPGRPGRPTRVAHKLCALGIALTFYASTSEAKVLCNLFAVTPTTLLRVIAKAELALLQMLAVLPEASVVWPRAETTYQWANATQAREPLIAGVVAFVDGKNLRVQEPTNVHLQNAYYNGWLHTVYATGVLCFGIDG
ncbi:hypothetical protein ACHHYP_05937 [Achlya hypogyna]|uniref:DDE Tnp4 domain-containing protein n=1 Tax=Achlya hypogyna TaxID=1202772 RepID=A0A1V9YW97_ACHHY|nr:hypothetical protein ACHHYP_05937 [Achlya hypogyna]